MGFISVFVVVGCVISCLMALWNIRRKKRIVQSVLTFPIMLAILSFAFGAPPMIWYFDSKLEYVFADIPMAADIVAADKCNLFSAENSDGTTRRIAFAGNFFFGPGISGMAYFSADGEKFLAMSAGSLKMINMFVDGDDPGTNIRDFSVYADGEKVSATLSSLLYGYKDEEAVLVMEKIAAAREARIVLTYLDESAIETELSAGDICRFRKLRDLWRGES